MPLVEGVEQQTPIWVAIRRGIVTSSRVADIMFERKDGQESAKRRNYLQEKRDEIVTLPRHAANHYVTPEMEWGIIHQPDACFAYELNNKVFTKPGGFWRHPEIYRFGSSPDYLVPGDPPGLMEAKCPTTRVHNNLREEGTIPEVWLWQMQAQMACTGAEWCDFVSYDPRVEPGLRLWIKRVERVDVLIQKLETEVRRFLDDLDRAVEKLRKGNSPTWEEITRGD